MTKLCSLINWHYDWHMNCVCNYNSFACAFENLVFIFFSPPFTSHLSSSSHPRTPGVAAADDFSTVSSLPLAHPFSKAPC